MKQYMHPDMDNWISPKAFNLNGVKYPRSWWQTVSEAEIEQLGFVEYVPEPQNHTPANILSAPENGFGGPAIKEFFHGNR